MRMANDENDVDSYKINYHEKLNFFSHSPQGKFWFGIRKFQIIGIIFMVIFMMDENKNPLSSIVEVLYHDNKYMIR